MIPPHPLQLFFMTIFWAFSPGIVALQSCKNSTYNTCFYLLRVSLYTLTYLFVFHMHMLTHTHTHTHTYTHTHTHTHIHTCSHTHIHTCIHIPVPAERTVISKERASGSYHLSAYYLAKTLSELPLLFMLPSLYIIIVYWAAGLNGPAGFFASWALLLLSGFTAQVSEWVGMVISSREGGTWIYGTSE